MNVGTCSIFKFVSDLNSQAVGLSSFHLLLDLGVTDTSSLGWKAFKE